MLRCWCALGLHRRDHDPLAEEIEAEIPERLPGSFGRRLVFCSAWQVLIVSSRMLVWGAVDVAAALGCQRPGRIGLTIVAAAGKYQPRSELAASVPRVRSKNEPPTWRDRQCRRLQHLESARGARRFDRGPAGPGITAAAEVPGIDDILVMLALTLALFVAGRRTQTTVPHQLQ